MDNYLNKLGGLSKLRICLSLILFALLGNQVSAAEDEHEEGEEEHVEISAALANELGIQTQIASSGDLKRTLLLYGKTMPDPQRVSHVSARFPGMIKSIIPALGDKVEAGQLIAVIEANSSLQNYEIRAPLSGTVVEKHANPGELVTDATLLTIANYESIWVDLTVFPGDSQQVVAGMPVTITMENLSADSSIRYLNPSQGESPVVIARVPLTNSNALWTPGLLVEGFVVIEEVTVDLAIEDEALQVFEGNEVVFVLEGNVYEPRPLTLGRTDGKKTEVLAGLAVGERYVVANSYLIKADLEKEGAEHDH